MRRKKDGEQKDGEQKDVEQNASHIGSTSAEFQQMPQQPSAQNNRKPGRAAEHRAVNESFQKRKYHRIEMKQ